MSQEKISSDSNPTTIFLKKEAMITIHYQIPRKSVIPISC